MPDATLLPFDLPAVRRKKLTVDFDGGTQSSDGGVLLLRAAEKKTGVIRPARVMAICCGHDYGIDHDSLRHDPALKMAVSRCPQSGAPLASQSTISRFENAPSRTDAARLVRALVDQLTARVVPAHLDIFDIDDTFDAARHGRAMRWHVLSSIRSACGC